MRLRSRALLTVYGAHPRTPGLEPPNDEKDDCGSENEEDDGEREGTDMRDAELRRLPDIGSDHFPLFVVLDYDPNALIENEVPQQEAGDEEAIDEGDNMTENQ